MRRVHLVGIGGIGMSALAQYYLSQGFEVTGSDLIDSPIIKKLKKSGAKIFVGQHKADNLADSVDLVVYSAAVEKNNLELKKTERKRIKSFSYAQALGELTKKFFTIAVSGMHGKSTTASMIALILVRAGLDPTVIVGTKLKEFGDSNFRLGKSRHLVIEADEYQASFLNYWPKIIALLNLDQEHLDYYKDLKHIIKIFREYVGHLPVDGALVVNRDDKNIEQLLNPKSEIRNPCLAGRRAKQIQNSKFKIQKFFLTQPEAEKLRKILKVPGEHNLSNALAALSVARVLKIPDKISFQTLAEYQGSWRRFEFKGISSGAEVYDDYGHHPTEIAATLKGARAVLKGRGSSGRLWLVFQPHQYQRTHKLFERFTRAFDEADELLLLPIYSVAGREKESVKKIVSSEKLIKAVQRPWSKNKKRAVYLPDFISASQYLKKNLKKNDLCIIMGAGDIWQLTQSLLGRT